MRRVLSALFAIVVAATSVEASLHGHAPAIAGWADGAAHVVPSHEDELNPCSICRLAHETSSAPLTPCGLTAPVHIERAVTVERAARPLLLADREHSPRAPPRPAFC